VTVTYKQPKNRFALFHHHQDHHQSYREMDALIYRVYEVLAGVEDDGIIML
jgi:hypothetical protein